MCRSLRRKLRNYSGEHKDRCALETWEASWRRVATELGVKRVRRRKALDATGVKMQRARWAPESRRPNVRGERFVNENEVKGKLVSHKEFRRRYQRRKVEESTDLIHLFKKHSGSQ